MGCARTAMLEKALDEKSCSTCKYTKFKPNSVLLCVMCRKKLIKEKS